MKKYFSYIVMFFTVIGFSCKTTQRIESSPNTAIEIIGAPSINEIHKNNFLFDWISAKVSAHVQGYQLSGQLKIRKDSVLWLSLNKFGFEIMRLKATQDSIFISNRIENEYYTGNYDFVEEKMGLKINYNMLESLLLGNDFNCFDTIPYKVTRTEQGFDFVFKNRAMNKECADFQKTKINQTFSVNRQNYRITKNILLPVGTNQEVQVSYFDFSRIDNLLFATQIAIFIPAMPEIETIEIKYSSVSLGKEQTFPFSIPKGAAQMN